MVKFLFEAGDQVLAYHGPQIYEAKVVKTELRPDPLDPDAEKIPMYLTHYSGWNKSWDEWLFDDRLLKYNDDGLELQEKLKLARAKKAKGKTPRVEAPRQAVARRDAEEPASKRRRGDRGGNTGTDASEKGEEIVLPIPDALKLRLIDDWNCITRQNKLLELPAERTITHIMDDYCKHVKSQGIVATSIAYEVTCGLKVYFENGLGPLLLYKTERVQFTELQEASPDAELCDSYGAEHLLRLLVKLPSMLSHARIGERGVAHLLVGLTDILKYLLLKETQLFLADAYVEYSEEYAKKLTKI